MSRNPVSGSLTNNPKSQRVYSACRKQVKSNTKNDAWNDLRRTLGNLGYNNLIQGQMVEGHSTNALVVTV